MINVFMIDTATQMHDVMSQNMATVYVCLFLAPFLQEDAAVIGAASLSLAGMGSGVLLFITILTGLSLSDLWKYWLGRAARSQAWAQRYADRPAVQKAERLVTQRLGASMMSVRFIPGTRIALYIAAGYFRANWPAFACWVVFSAAVYIGLAFGLFHVVGAAAGETAKTWLPIIAIGVLGVVLSVQALRKRGSKQYQSTGA